MGKIPIAQASLIYFLEGCLLLVLAAQYGRRKPPPYEMDIDAGKWKYAIGGERVLIREIIPKLRTGDLRRR